VDPGLIRDKFGDDYKATEKTFIMGIDQRFTRNIARRFTGKVVLEACTGGGFTTIALAREAKHVLTFEIEPSNQKQAIHNINLAGLADKVTFVLGDVLDPSIIDHTITYDAAFLDPDWAIRGPDHVFRFKPSNTIPPLDILLTRIFEITPNIAMILSPKIHLSELTGFTENEIQRLYLGASHELYCVYFGDLKKTSGFTEYRV
jgi:hypothetical protein